MASASEGSAENMAKILKEPDWLESFECDWTKTGRLTIERISNTVPGCLQLYLASIQPEEWPMALTLIKKEEDHCFSDTGISFSCNWSSDEEDGEEESQEQSDKTSPTDRQDKDSVKIFAGPMTPLEMPRVHFLETIKQALEQSHIHDIAIKGENEFFEHVQDVKASLSKMECSKEKEVIDLNAQSQVAMHHGVTVGIKDSPSDKQLSPEYPSNLKEQHQKEVAVRQDMSMNILLVGFKGNGKSHTGNTILKKEVFRVSRRGGTQESQVGTSIVKVDGVSRLMMTVDTPGVSQEMTESEFEELVRAVKMVPEGFDAICLVWDYKNSERNEDKEVQVFQSLHRLFGDELYDHLVILVTHAQQEDIPELMKGLPANLKKIAEKANRVLQDDVQELLHAVHELSTKFPKYKASHLSPSCQIPSGDELRISLVGKTGSGKSHTGNVIIGKYDYFSISDKASSETQICQYHTRNRGDREITVLDTPGVFDTGEKKGITQELCRMVTIFHDGLHAVILVMKCGRYTVEESESVKIFLYMFGERFLDYSVILFTHRDQLVRSTEQEYMDTAPPHMKEAVARCGGRYVFFNNATNDVTILKAQVAKLVNLIQDICERQGKPYSDPLFQEGEKMWQTIIREIPVDVADKDPVALKRAREKAIEQAAIEKAKEMDYEGTSLFKTFLDKLMSIMHRLVLIFKAT